MDRSLTFVGAFVAAALAPVAVFLGTMLLLGGKAVLTSLPLMGFSSFVVSAGHVLFLGLPAVFTLHKLGRLRLRATLLVGLVAGCVPMAITTWPVTDTNSGYTSNGVELLVNGIPTAAGWARYCYGVLSAGLLGAIGGLAFYLTLRGFSPNNSFKPKPLRGSP